MCNHDQYVSLARPPEGTLHCLQTLRASENLLVQLDAWPSSQDTSESVCVRLFGLYSFPEMDQLLLQENVYALQASDLEGDAWVVVVDCATLV